MKFKLLLASALCFILFLEVLPRLRRRLTPRKLAKKSTLIKQKQTLRLHLRCMRKRCLSKTGSAKGVQKPKVCAPLQKSKIFVAFKKRSASSSKKTTFFLKETQAFQKPLVFACALRLRRKTEGF